MMGFIDIPLCVPGKSEPIPADCGVKVRNTPNKVPIQHRANVHTPITLMSNLE